MNVENILFVVVGILVFGYRTWQNFKKQEENRPTIRKPGDLQPEMEERPVPRKSPFDEMLEEWLDEKPVERPAPEPKYEPMKPEPVPHYAEHVRKPVELVNPEKPVAEVVRTRKQQEKHHHHFNRSEVEEDVASEYAGFDARDAMIKKMILERPEY